MKKRSHWCYQWIISVLFSVTTLANEGGRIYFPAGKNGSRLLSQKLEYHIVDDDTIRLGNMLIKTNDVRIEVSQVTESKPQFSFYGPSQLMKNATIIIRDPTGRSVWSYQINNSNLEELGSATDKIASANLNNKLAVLRLPDTSAEMLRNLNNSIFFNYCIFYEDENHRYNLCSKDYRLEKVSDKWVLTQIASAKKEFIVQVNGTEVGAEGTIQISEKLSTVSFSSRLASGLLVEFRTGNIPIEVIDSKWDSQSDFANLTIREKNKDDKFNLKKAWESKVAFTQSFFYLEGESQIPLKQEIFFEEKPPSEKVRPTLNRKIFKTYSSSLTVYLKRAPTTIIKTKTAGDKIINRKIISEWELNNIKGDGSNVHYMEISSGDKTYFASYEVLRGRPWTIRAGALLGQSTMSTDAEISASKQSDNGIEINFQYHASSFLGIHSDWAQLRWFTELDWAQIKTKAKDSEAVAFSQSHLDFGYRFSYGFHHETPSAGMTFGFFQRQSQDESATSPSVGLFYKNPIVQIPLLGHQFYFGVKIIPSLVYAKSKATGSITRIDLNNQYALGEKNYWIWGLSYLTEAMKSTSPNSSQLHVQSTAFKLGFGSNF